MSYIPYISYREPNEDGLLCYYILQKAHPNYVGIIANGILEKALSYAVVPGYSLYVNFAGTIQGNFIPHHQFVLEEIGIVMTAMSDWFLYNRIATDLKKYNKFAINANHTKPV